MKKFCAHRGVSALMPENTLPAFAAALSLGADEIEFDVRLTRDYKLIVSHDGTLERISDGEGKLKESELGMLPIYIGVDGEEDQGLCTGSENYWCINKNASEADIQATLDFLEWLVTSEEGTKALADDMGFVSPFKKAKESSNVLNRIANEYIAAGKKPVSWVFATMPSEDWKNGVGAAMVSYAQGKSDFNAVKNAFVNGWKTEYDKIKK